MTSSPHDDSVFSIDELKLNGNAHLAFQTLPNAIVPPFRFRAMIGDRSASLHVGPGQFLILERDFLDLPFSTQIYQHGHARLAHHTLLDNINVSILYGINNFKIIRINN